MILQVGPCSLRLLSLLSSNIVFAVRADETNEGHDTSVVLSTPLPTLDKNDFGREAKDRKTGRSRHL